MLENKGRGAHNVAEIKQEWLFCDKNAPPCNETQNVGCARHNGMFHSWKHRAACLMLMTGQIIFMCNV